MKCISVFLHIQTCTTASGSVLAVFCGVSPQNHDGQDSRGFVVDKSSTTQAEMLNGVEILLELAKGLLGCHGDVSKETAVAESTRRIQWTFAIRVFQHFKWVLASWGFIMRILAAEGVRFQKKARRNFEASTSQI